MYLKGINSVLALLSELFFTPGHQQGVTKMGQSASQDVNQGLHYQSVQQTKHYGETVLILPIFTYYVLHTF